MMDFATNTDFLSKQSKGFDPKSIFIQFGISTFGVLSGAHPSRLLIIISVDMFFFFFLNLN